MSLGAGSHRGPMAVLGLRIVVALVGLAWANEALAWQPRQRPEPAAEDPARDPSGPGPGGVLDLPDDGFIAGELLPSAAGADGRVTLQWRSSAFTAPFTFDLATVVGVRFRPEPRAQASDGLRLHLRGGDVLSARLEAIDEAAFTVSLFDAGAEPQTVRIERSAVERITRPGSSAGSYVGPGGIAGWRQAPAGTWRDEAGRIVTSRRGAAVERDVSAPVRARYDLIVSWRKAAEFRVAVAAAEHADADGYGIEVLGTGTGRTAMLVRQDGQVAKLEPIDADVVGDRLRIVIFVDQERGRLAAIVPGGGQADVTVAPTAGGPPSGRFRFTLTRGDICFESLRVAPWVGEEPSLDEVAETVVTTSTGRLQGVRLVGFDAAAGDLEVEVSGTPRRLGLDAIDEIAFPADDAAPAASRGGVRVVRADGDTLSGGLDRVAGDGVRILRTGVEPPVVVPFASILAIESLEPRAETAADPEGAPRVGRMDGAGLSLRGRLVGDASAPGGMAFQPLGSPTPAGLVVGADGWPAMMLEYANPRPREISPGGEVGGIGGAVQQDEDGRFVVSMLAEDGAAASDGRIQPGDHLVAVRPGPEMRFVETKGLDLQTVMNLLRGRVGTAVWLLVAPQDGGEAREIDLVRGSISIMNRQVLEQALQTHARLASGPQPGPEQEDHPALVFLVSGDVVPCRVYEIDEAGLRITTPTTAAGPILVPAASVKALELIPAAASRAIDKSRLDRLLTLPRMQRSRPPTHLLRLVSGDYLRGRLVSLDATHVLLELLGETKRLPREQVARIIWLHPEEADTTDAPEPGPLVQGVSASGRRITLVPERLDDGVIEGRSPALGQARLPLEGVDRLLFGRAIDRDVSDLPYQRWKLMPAAEPRALRP